jgi:hypothetical protein
MISCWEYVVALYYPGTWTGLPWVHNGNVSLPGITKALQCLGTDIYPFLIDCVWLSLPSFLQTFGKHSKIIVYIRSHAVKRQIKTQTKTPMQNQHNTPQWIISHILHHFLCQRENNLGNDRLWGKLFYYTFYIQMVYALLFGLFNLINCVCGYWMEALDIPLPGHMVKR